MKTTTFLKRIIDVFRPVNVEAYNNQNLVLDSDSKPPIALLPETDSKAELPLKPTVEVQAVPAVPSLAGSESQHIKSHDLASWAMEQCIATNGSTQGMQSALEVVRTNFLLEARTKEEELKAELSRAINENNTKIISLNNEIAIIRELHIPEKEQQISRLDTQLNQLQMTTRFDVQTDYGSEVYTILATSRARTREIIRKLQTKIVELQIIIQQVEQANKLLMAQREQINLIDKNIIIRRMNLFLTGWLKGMAGLDADAQRIADTKSFFDNYHQHIIQQFS